MYISLLKRIVLWKRRKQHRVNWNGVGLTSGALQADGVLFPYAGRRLLEGVKNINGNEHEYESID